MVIVNSFSEENIPKSECAELQVNYDETKKMSPEIFEEIKFHSSGNSDLIPMHGYVCPDCSKESIVYNFAQDFNFCYSCGWSDDKILMVKLKESIRKRNELKEKYNKIKSKIVITKLSAETSTD